MKKYINYFIIGSFLTFVLLMVLVLTCDVQTVLTTGTELGLFEFNNLFTVQGNAEYDAVSDFLLYTSFMLVVIFAINGLYQLIKFKSLKKVDGKIISFGIIMVLMVIVWILFDKLIIINYRPILIDGKLEGSFPSTHVMVVTFIYLATPAFLQIKNKTRLFKIVIYIVIAIAIILVSVTRILSSMHWFTDVIGGIIIGLFFYFCFLKSVYQIENKKTNVSN